MGGSSLDRVSARETGRVANPRRPGRREIVILKLGSRGRV